MRPTDDLLTRNETAVLVGASIHAVNKAIEAGVVRRVRRGSAAFVRVGDAAALGLLVDMRLPLPVVVQRRVRAWVAAGPPQLGDELQIAAGLRVVWTPSAAVKALRVQRYCELRGRYVSVRSDWLAGEPVVKGTWMPIRDLARIADGGMTRQQMRKDMPEVPQAAYDLAVWWTRANPRKGRPAGRTKPRASA